MGMNERGIVIVASDGWEQQERALPERTTKKKARELLYQLWDNDSLGLDWSLWIDGECVLTVGEE